MRKSILFLIVFVLAVIAAFAQADTVVVDNSPTEIPDWISYALNAVLSFIAVWLGKAKVRLAKAVTLLDTLAKVAERGSVNNADIQNVVQQAKELVAKEKS